LDGVHSAGFGLLSIELSELAAVACWGAVWVRLVILSGLYGLYQAVWPRAEWFSIVASSPSTRAGGSFERQPSPDYS